MPMEKNKIAVAALMTPIFQTYFYEKIPVKDPVKSIIVECRAKWKKFFLALALKKLLLPAYPR